MCNMSNLMVERVEVMVGKAAVSALHRICMSSSSLAAFTSAFTDLKSELRSLLYPDSVITKAFNRVISHSRFTALS